MLGDTSFLLLSEAPRLRSVMNPQRLCMVMHTGQLSVSGVNHRGMSGPVKPANRAGWRSPSLSSLGGRGLAIVDHLCSTWGIRSCDGGMTVWAELPAPGGGPAGPRADNGASPVEA